MLGVLCSATVVRAASVDIPSTEFKLLSEDGSVEIGRAHFKIAARSGGREQVQGKYQFTNGEYDFDEDWLEIRPDATLPKLLRYRHAYFHPDGSRDRVNEADLRSGQASCTVYVHGHAETKSEKLTFPSDTYAGPAVALAIRELIRDSSSARVGFHDFNCAPGPKIYLVRLYVERAVHWRLYPGEQVQVDIKPDLGRLNLLVAPFLPKIRLWFDSTKDFELVGAESSRYYKGLNFIMVHELIVR